MNKQAFKKTDEELHQYLSLMRKHNVVENKKGKGSYKRQPKHRPKYTRGVNYGIN